ncbi:FGGY family carbohydrate kinase [Ferrimonas marina]|nr:FGGY family carbohydrate kinase [Ferrimonas marina]
MADPVILAVDVGTQSVRALLVAANGEILGQAKEPLSPPYLSEYPGWAELPAERFWQALCHAVRAARAQHPSTLVAALALTTQRNSYLALDAKGVPLGPALLWPDQRQVPSLPPLPQPWRALLALPPWHQRVVEARRKAPALRLAHYRPKQWQRCHTLATLSAYLTQRLTGRCVDSLASQVGYLPFNYHQKTWYPQGHWRWAAFGLHPDQLYPLLPPGSEAGTLNVPSQQALGLTPMPVLVTGGDKACEVLGCGGQHRGVLNISLGSAISLNLYSPDPINAGLLMPPYPAATPEGFLTERLLPQGMAMLDQLIQRYSVGPGQASLQAGLVHPPAAALVESLRALWPRLAGDDAAMAELDSLHHQWGLAALYRAAVAVILETIQTQAQQLARRHRIVLSHCRVAGGGSRSLPLLQCLANHLNLPVQRMHTNEASALGAAVCGALALGWHPDVESAQQAMCHPQAAVLPHSD